MKAFFLSIIFLVVTSAARAAEIADDFNRANTAQIANTVNVGGTGWVQDGDATATGSDWFINNNTVAGRNRVQVALLYNNSLETVSGSGTNFVLRTDVSAKLLNAYAGITFNYQNASNYYVVRFKGGTTTYQMLKVVDGTNAQVIVSKTDSSQAFAVDSFYTITVTSDTAGAFDFTMTAAGSPTVLNTVTTGVDTTGSSFDGGYAGMYLNTAALGPYAKFNNFSLEVNSAKSLQLILITSL